MSNKHKTDNNTPDNLFYAAEITGNYAMLNEEESHHCTKVMRYKTGDNLWATDGKGTIFFGILTKADSKACMIEILKQEHLASTKKPNLIIAIAPPKNPSRFEWFLEKATEIGVTAVQPLICERSYKTHYKTERMEKIVLSAMKQSLNTYLPLILPAVSFSEYCRKDFEGQKMIAYCKSGNKYINRICKPNIKTVICIGPEGDFSPEEIDMAIEHGFIPINLGESRLRTETAGITACILFNSINQF